MRMWVFFLWLSDFKEYKNLHWPQQIMSPAGKHQSLIKMQKRAPPVEGYAQGLAWHVVNLLPWDAEPSFYTE